jgi:hypothetical protein
MSGLTEILEMDRKPVEHQQVIDGGVVGLHVGALHEAVGREIKVTIDVVARNANPLTETIKFVALY